MKKNIFLLILSITIIFLNFTNAQKKIPLSLEQCIEIGLKNSYLIRLSSLNVEAAEAKVSMAHSAQLPSFKFYGTYSRLSIVPPFEIQLPVTIPIPNFPNKFMISPSISNNYQFKLTVQQPIFTGFMLSSFNEMAGYNFESVKNDYVRERNELIYKIKSAYWNLFKAIEFKKVIDENVDQMELHLKNIKNFFKLGLVTNSAVLQVQVQLSNSKMNQIEADNNIKLAMVNLNNIINIPLEIGIDLTSEIKKHTYEFMDLNQLVQKAYQLRPELKSIENKIKASEYSVQNAKSDYFPQLYLVGNYNYSRPNQRYWPMQERFDGTWDVSLSLQWDIWNWGKTSSKVTEANVGLLQAKNGLEIYKNGITLEVTNNYLNSKKVHESIIVAEETVKQAQENYIVTSDKFKEGLALNADLLDAEVALLMAKMNYTSALVNYELSFAMLQKSIGE